MYLGALEPTRRFSFQTWHRSLKNALTGTEETQVVIQTSIEDYVSHLTFSARAPLLISPQYSPFSPNFRTFSVSNHLGHFFNATSLPVHVSRLHI